MKIFYSPLTRTFTGSKPLLPTSLLASVLTVQAPIFGDEQLTEVVSQLTAQAPCCTQTVHQACQGLVLPTFWCFCFHMPFQGPPKLVVWEPPQCLEHNP